MPSRDGVYSIEPDARYAIVARCAGHRQASLTEAIVFSPQHFDDGLSDRLELTVELESELFEALVRVVDDETGRTFRWCHHTTRWLRDLRAFTTNGLAAHWEEIGRWRGPPPSCLVLPLPLDESRRRRRVSN